jgi:hypothetical protein
MSASVTVTTSAGSATGSAPSPKVWVKTGTLAARAVASAPAPTVIIGSPLVVLAYVVAQPCPHLAAHHDDPIAYGTEVALAVVVLFVGWRLVAGRVFRS